jgi:hypothetical protein
LLQIEDVCQPILRITMQPQRVVERLVEDSNRFYMRIG